MKENMDNLQKEWEDKLAAEGLPTEAEIKRREKVPIEFVPEVVAREGRFTQEEIDRVFDLYEDLPHKLQENILEDLKNKRDEGMTRRDILDRFAMLIAKSEELMTLPDDESDMKYTPTDVNNEQEFTELEDAISNKVDDIIKRAERIINSDNRKKPSEETVN